MDIIEIRNNLVKFSYGEEESPQLGQFIALTTNNKSYVAQYVNLKADSLNNFAVARLMFTFTKDGVVSEYDGSIPSAACSLVNLAPEELLDLLPIETPIKMGKIAGQNTMLNIDISVFEHNFTIFSHYDNEKNMVISNLVRQLFRLKEKSVIIDIDGIYSEYKSLKLAKDFKLPLTVDMIDYIFEYDLKEVDKTTKAIIQDIFSAVCQYIKTLKDQFLPIDSFIEVVTAQYKETQMPELALLKNKLLKYQEAGIFANSSDEFSIINEKLNEGNCTVIDLKNINGELQKEIITHIHSKLEAIDKYIYFFVPVNNENSDKKLIKKMINNNHVFTTFIAPHNYKYASELKDHAQDIMFFAPQDIQHDFAAYNTFLNKLNPQEAVICGGLTQGVPLIISVENLDLDLTKEDVFGDVQMFFPAIEKKTNVPESKKTPIPTLDAKVNKDTAKNIQEPVETINKADVTMPPQPEKVEAAEKAPEEKIDANVSVIEPVENLLSDDYASEDDISTSEESDNDLDQDELTEDDLDFIENTQEDDAADNLDDIDLSDIDGYDDESVPVVPVYTPEEDEGEEVSGDEIGYSKGEKVSHPRYGEGVIEKIIKYGNKTLCSITFDNVGRRLLDPSISEFEKI